ncbi:unnamed protein product [Arabidopsis thaliana]|uniref:Methenyltetrahydrofolate cyclohydrolase n=1 Tax=Arabidopsis thaliana TaxID=3702 RepID=A0A654F1F7_ARATH|nr:unnamed protein product [Arabidopsis thaliana]
MLMIARKALASAHTKAFRLATRDVHCFSSILVSPPLVSLDLPENWIPYSDPPPPVSFETEQKTVVIDGNVIAEEIRTKIISEVGKMKKGVGKVPGLAVVLVGEQRDSQTYVRNKIKACEETGIKSVLAELPEDCTEGQIISVLRKFNEDTSIHGILVQLPLPQHLDESKILNMVRLEKDVDGFHPLNVGNLAMRGREPLFVSCTPKGCVELLIRTGVEIAGKNAVVIGRSNIVGLPMSLLLQRHDATVSTVHAFTKDPEHITRKADIVIAAAGIPNLVRGSWLKPGAVVIDVGTTPVEDSSCEFGYRLVGDVCYEEALGVASAITPVPGGVGPMTITMLLCNTLEAAKRIFL